MGFNPHDLQSLVQEPEDKAPDWAWAMHYFLKQGISYNEFKDLPLPYIFLMLKTARLENEEKERQLDR